MNIVFFGTPEFALPSLHKLIEADFNVVAVVTTPDEPTGRNAKPTPPPVKVFAEQNGLRIFQPSSLKENDFFDIFCNLKPDICIIVAYGKIIPQKYLDIPKYGFVNIHPSLLPKYRGPSPIQSAILNGDAETGISLIKIDDQMDHGPIITQINYTISNDKYYAEIEVDMAELGAKLLVDNLSMYIDSTLKPVEQDHASATIVKKFNRIDGKIDWSKSAEQIRNQIRALNPNPGTWTTLNDKTLNIFKADIVELDSKDDVIREKSRLLLKTGDGYISPTLLQLEGKKVLSIKEFLNGFHETDIYIL
jgi:methionyl-tRNA formyltransferase